MLGMPERPAGKSRGKAGGRRRSDRPEVVLTIDELAVYLKLAKSTAYKLAQEGKIPGQKVGRHWRFHKDAVDAWLIAGKQEGSGRPGSGASAR